jgi:hypothetical protein
MCPVNRKRPIQNRAQNRRTECTLVARYLPYTIFILLTSAGGMICCLRAPATVLTDAANGLVFADRRQKPQAQPSRRVSLAAT